MPHINYILSDGLTFLSDYLPRIGEEIIIRKHTKTCKIYKVARIVNIYEAECPEQYNFARIHHHNVFLEIDR